MNDRSDPAGAGPADARYRAFLETVSSLRPRLHRYCSRMTGSVSDGEDVVQEALFQAYRRLDTFDDARPLAPWLFGIAHNRCIDFLRRTETREQAEAGAEMSEDIAPVDPPGPPLGRAVEYLVLALPPMERSCVLLKDVFDHSLEEIGDLVGSSVGGVKAALHRGREKLAVAPRPTSAPRAPSAELRRIVGLYVERFNRRDWDGVRELIAADARLRVADAFDGALADSPYFGNYERLRIPWRVVVGEVDGEPVIIQLRQQIDGWASHSFARIEVASGRVTRILDFWHTPWVLGAATSVHISEPN